MESVLKLIKKEIKRSFAFAFSLKCLSEFNLSRPIKIGRERSNFYTGSSSTSSGRHLLALPPPPTPTVHSNSKSNMTGQINDRELKTLARTNKTPPLRTKSFSKGSFT